MKIQSRACGPLQTNCFIVSNSGQDIIIDPGQDSVDWVKRTVTKPVAIFNTHGHFDHVWSNAELAKYFQIPIYCPKDDCDMLAVDTYSCGQPISRADIEVKEGEFELIGLKVNFLHYPGHTPGASMILINGHLFSGDVIFAGTIGRYDFPGSDAKQMRQSLEHFLKIKSNYPLYPGHGAFTDVATEQANVRQILDSWR